MGDKEDDKEDDMDNTEDMSSQNYKAQPERAVPRKETKFSGRRQV